ncbi:MAG: DUF3137 domain-containing protein [Campylobacter sp.]|nr:DUF3137 domain-containing protein [Campylobacter sp.]
MYTFTFIAVFGLLFVFVNLFVIDFKEKKLEFANFIKAKIISSMLDPSYKYDPKAGLGSKFINNTGIYASAFYITHDLIMGIYNGVRFIVETFKEERDYSNDTVGKLINLAYQAKYELSKFNGLISGIKSDKNFTSKTIVVDRAFNTKIDGKVEILGNTTFNDEFRVFSDNPAETRYLLSFVDIEKILKFQSEIALGKASFAFIDGKFYLFLNGLHFNYEPSLTLVINPKKIENFVNNINKTIAYIDFFKDTKDKNG